VAPTPVCFGIVVVKDYEVTLLFCRACQYWQLLLAYPLVITRLIDFDDIIFLGYV